MGLDALIGGHRPRIAILGGAGGPSGVARYIHHVARALSPEADITVISDKNRGGLDFVEREGWLHIEISGLARSYDPRKNLGVWRQLRDSLRGGNFDLLWANSSFPILLARLIQMQDKALGRKLITTYHGLPFGAGRRRYIASATWFLELLSLAVTPRHDLIFLSGKESRALPGWLLARHRTSVLSNCSDISEIPGTMRRPVYGPRQIIMATRHCFQKNLPAAARIFAQMPPDCRLTLVGAGTNSKALRKCFGQILGAEALCRVAFVGPVCDVRPYLERADCYLMTSRYEGVSIGMLEAFECGLPVAMPSIGGAPEMIEHHPMFRCISLDSEQTAARIIIALIDEFRQNRSVAARYIHASWARRFSFSQWQIRVRALAGQALQPTPNNGAEGLFPAPFFRANTHLPQLAGAAVMHESQHSDPHINTGSDRV